MERRRTEIGGFFDPFIAWGWGEGLARDGLQLDDIQASPKMELRGPPIIVGAEEVSDRC